MSCAALAQSQIGVDYTWKLKHRCASISPELRLTGIPTGTTEISVMMKDHDRPGNDHGGGFLKNDDGFPPEFVIAEGGLNRGYRGPCNPVFESFGHDYEFYVTAKDAKGEILGKGSLKKTYARKFVPD
jgi:phosphatidylethanolamine-binding protein (PEBP) family uncharacterized protein